MAVWLAFGGFRRRGRPGRAGPAAIIADHGAAAIAGRAGADAVIEPEGVEAGGAADGAGQSQGGEPVAHDLGARQSRDESGDQPGSGCQSKSGG
jgi:hypothetical protein